MSNAKTQKSHHNNAGRNRDFWVWIFAPIEIVIWVWDFEKWILMKKEEGILMKWIFGGLEEGKKMVNKT